MVHNFDPVLINLGFIKIHWYSLAYIFGILIGWWYGRIIIKKKISNVERDNYIKNYDDLISYIIIGVIVGGRLGYIIFYNPSYFIEDPLQIFKIWEGGMSFHGALVGVVIGTHLFAKSIETETLLFLDIIACVAPIGIFFGRIANFINGELFGKPTNVPWSVIFPQVDNVPRHPSQIYEAFFEGVLLFLILLPFIYNKKVKTGLCSGLFLIFYGFFRILAEQFREPDLQIGYLFNHFSLGSILSLIMIVAGILILQKIKKNERST